MARRDYGETIAHLVAPTRYPYQFAGNYARYAEDPNTLAVDTHCLIALMAPRPLLLQTGNADNWSAVELDQGAWADVRNLVITNFSGPVGTSGHSVSAYPRRVPSPMRDTSFASSGRCGRRLVGFPAVTGNGGRQDSQHDCARTARARSGIAKDSTRRTRPGSEAGP